jgi:hypothetical protein
LKANLRSWKQEIINLYDEYTLQTTFEVIFEGSLLTGGMTAALTISPSLEMVFTQVPDNEFGTEEYWLGIKVSTLEK